MYRAVMLIIALTLASPAAAQQPCTTDARRVVDELYRHMLERSADQGSAHWVQQLENGGMTVRDVVRQIAKSQEHMNRFYYTESGESTPYERSVARLYRHILGRQPDEAGQRANAELAQRSGAAALIDRIIDSREYSQQFGDWRVPGSGGVTYCAPGNAVSQQSTYNGSSSLTRRFRGMDTNRDGVISRSEWRGNIRAFEAQDWNNDDVLSGSELEPGGARLGRRSDRFEELDTNNNGRIESREWDGSVAAFNRLDVNNDNVLSAAEVLGTADVAATSGQVVNVDSSTAWTQTGITVRQGDLLTFDTSGTVQLSSDSGDVAGPAGARTGRRAARAPLRGELAGALIGRIGNRPAFAIGDQRSIEAPYSGPLFLGVNDDFLGDNSGHFRVMVDQR